MNRTANIIKALRQACWILLLTLYAAAALKVDSFHELFHAQEIKELHSLEHENNPCHKSIYHQESQKGCEHKSHITENTKCPLCEFNFVPDQLAAEKLEQETISFKELRATTRHQSAPNVVACIVLSRGPPANV